MQLTSSKFKKQLPIIFSRIGLKCLYNTNGGVGLNLPLSVGLNFLKYLMIFNAVYSNRDSDSRGRFIFQKHAYYSSVYIYTLL